MDLVPIWCKDGYCTPPPPPNRSCKNQGHGVEFSRNKMCNIRRAILSGDRSCYSIFEFLLPTWIQRYDKNHFIFDPVQKGETLKFYRLSGAKFYDYINTIQSTLVISNSKGLSEILRDIRTLTYQICRIEEKIIWTTTFNKYICYWTLEVRDILKILWKRGEIAP